MKLKSLRSIASKPMNDASPWRISTAAPDWECDWDGDKLFHLRYFRALTLPEKIRAIEEMEAVAAFFATARSRPSNAPKAAPPR